MTHTIAFTAAIAGGPVLTTEDAYVQEARPSSEGRWVVPEAIARASAAAMAAERAAFALRESMK